MAMNSLKDIYLDQLQDIWSANTQSLSVVTELGRAAQDEELSEALIAGGNGIADGIAEIEKLCNEHGAPTDCPMRSRTLMCATPP